MSGKKVAILGNPNSGKSSIFNRLTGLSVKVGNFPGVTVEKKQASLKLPSGNWVDLIDFPGVYSLHPNSKDEFIVTSILSNEKDQDFPDLILYIADITHLEKQLLLFTQLIDLGIPVIMVLTMKDLAEKDNLKFDIEALKKNWQIPIFSVNARTQDGIQDILTAVDDFILHGLTTPALQYKLNYKEQSVANEVSNVLGVNNSYQALLNAHYAYQLGHVTVVQKEKIKGINIRHGFNSLVSQIQETMQRYDGFTDIVRKASTAGTFKISKLTDKADNILTHKIWGLLIFLAVNVLIFQAMFSFAAYPMDWIETGISYISSLVHKIGFPAALSGFISDGILAGLGGILVFIPQIAILFFLITVLEDSGYMARAVYMFDGLFQKFGLNGRSLVSLVSGGACAIPAIMNTRTISNQKERLITTLVTPFISCSARIPVYTILVAFVTPASYRIGPFNGQGLLFMGLYLLGISTALLAAFILHKIIKSKERSFLMIELPDYKSPDIKVAFQTAWIKSKAFVLEAGKVILIISMILWVLSSFGPSSRMANLEAEVEKIKSAQSLSDQAADDLLASKRLENSYAGIIGKWVEPAIKPLGFDWKIGIALITSFAAREVFVGTISTLYSLGSNEDYVSIQNRLASEKDNLTGKPRFSVAVSLSLLLFYVFAMQCMSTMAVVKRETGSWKWPIIQFLFMSGIAYVSSFVAFQALS